MSAVVWPAVVLLTACSAGATNQPTVAATAAESGELQSRSGAGEAPDGFSEQDAGTIPTDRPPAAPETTAPSYPLHFAYPFLRDIYLSDDSGVTWRSLRINEGINASTYLSAAAVSPDDPAHLVVGTTFVGLFESTDGGATWLDLGDQYSALQFFYRGSGFYEEVRAVTFDADNPDLLYIDVDFGIGRYVLSRATDSVEQLSDADVAELPDWFRNPIDYQPPAVAVRRSARLMPNRVGSVADGTGNAESEAARRRELAADRGGIYLNPYQTTPDRLARHLDFVIDHGMNSIVVDFKDDYGVLRYNSQLDITRQVGSVDAVFNAKALIDAAHARGVYVIARQVVFKDRALFRYRNNQYALWDRATNRPWGVFRREEVPAPEPPEPAETAEQAPAATASGDAAEPVEPTYRWIQVEHWVDPYSAFVHDYNIRIALELQELGVDEVQFDYIRFPSDGDTRSIQARFRTAFFEANPHDEDPTYDRVAALTAFLAAARAQLTVPISVDVFGFNAWSRMSYLGQDVEAIGPFVDVISPMWYPSHFSRDFLPTMRYLDRAEFIYDHGSERMRQITPSVLIRPYVQAFLIGGELNFDTPTYVDYLNRQINGAARGGASGFSLWNASGRYYMVDGASFPGMP